MGMIAPLDSAFLIQEAREHPMHVGGLQLYHPPVGRGPAATEDDAAGHVATLYRELLRYRRVAPLFSRRPRDPVESLGNLWWKLDDPATRSKCFAPPVGRVSRGMGRMMADYGRAALRGQTAVLPYAAPRSMLNKPTDRGFSYD